MAKARSVSVCACMCVLLMGASVQAQPFAQALTPEGKQLHASNCQRCHDNMYNDRKGEQIYTSEMRKIKDAVGLRQRVESCAAQIGAGWFDEEIDHVSRYLNDQFYRFKK